MRAVSLALSVALGAACAACGSHVSPDDAPSLPVDDATDWWLGDWVVDLGALDSAESFRALAPEAQSLARDLVTGARWRLAFDSRRVHLPDGRLVPFRVDARDETRATLVLATGEQLTLARRTGGLLLASHDLPLRRAN
jgi:hypothetical protein